MPFNIATGIFVGVLLGIAAAMGRALIDRSVKTPDDVEKDLGVTFLGLLPEIGEDEADGQVRQAAPARRAAEARRHRGPSSSSTITA